MVINCKLGKFSKMISKQNLNKISQIYDMFLKRCTTFVRVNSGLETNMSFKSSLPQLLLLCEFVALHDRGDAPRHYHAVNDILNVNVFPFNDVVRQFALQGVRAFLFFVV